MTEYILYFWLMWLSQYVSVPFNKGATGITISRAQHTLSSSTNCSPTCSITVTSTGSGNLLVLSYASTTATATHISSISNGGTWTSAGACQGSDTTNGAWVDLGYTLSSSSGVTSISATLSQNDTAAVIYINEYHGTGGTTWSLDGGCHALTNPTAVEPTTSGSFVQSGAHGVIVNVMYPNHTYCSGEAVSGSGWTTPVLDIGPGGQANNDAVNVAAATYQMSINQMFPCPSTTSTASYTSAGFGFKYQ